MMQVIRMNTLTVFWTNLVTKTHPTRPIDVVQVISRAILKILCYGKAHISFTASCSMGRTWPTGTRFGEGGDQFEKKNNTKNY